MQLAVFDFRAALVNPSMEAIQTPVVAHSIEIDYNPLAERRRALIQLFDH